VLRRVRGLERDATGDSGEPYKTKRLPALNVSISITPTNIWTYRYSKPTVVMKLSLVTLLSASALASAIPVAEPEPILDERQAAQSIHAAMVAKGKKYFGTCADQGRLNAGSNSAIIKANFGQVTPENSYVIPSLVLVHPHANVQQLEMGCYRVLKGKLQLWPS
jgi:hypothetical protein